MKNDFQPFMLERDMGIWEHQVKYNLSESGVHPLTSAELLGEDPSLVEQILNVELNYPPTNQPLSNLPRSCASLMPSSHMVYHRAC